MSNVIQKLPKIPLQALGCLDELVNSVAGRKPLVAATALNHQMAQLQPRNVHVVGI